MSESSMISSHFALRVFAGCSMGYNVPESLLRCLWLMITRYQPQRSESMDCFR